ncbi:MAG TPA: proton-conducting transporter membrane subunit [Gammaproteobacteria bacterium]|nr:proton-conducting transporter membrane subunit [Gammaproteobacteria bacterium]
MTAVAVYLLVVLPPLATVVVSLSPVRASVATWCNLAAAVIALVASAVLTGLTISLGPTVAWGGYLLLDPLGAWTVLCVAIVYLLSSLYAIQYMARETAPARLPRFYALFAGFALTMFLAPTMNNPGLYWIAIELTTLVSTFLVGFGETRESTEAAWKYIIIVSAGITLALMGTLLMYWAGTFVLGDRYDMTWASLTQAAAKGDDVVVELAFLLILVGYGTKVGLAPMHTWLPDAHSQGPTPVSAMLSGALLNTAIVGIVRSLPVVEAVGRSGVGHGAMILLGIASLAVAALLIVRQTDTKRLMAYSSVEHMGVITLAFGFGGPLGVAAALYHMVGHSLNKSLMFFGAGNAAIVHGTKHMDDIREVLRCSPVSGGLWLAGAVAITGAPPFALFLSEFTTVRAGLASGWWPAAVAMLVLLLVIFVGFLNHFRSMYFEPRERVVVARSLGLLCLAPMWMALVPLLVLGVWWPASLQHVFDAVAAGLLGAGGATP